MPYKKLEQEDFPHRKARLVNCGGDLTKRWYVVYYAWNPETAKLQRKRIYINEFKTARERTDAAKQLIKDINQELIAGAIIDTKPAEREPEATPELQVADLRRMNVVDAVEYAVKLKISESDRKATSDTYNSVFSIFKSWLERSGNDRLRITEVNNLLLIAFFDYLRTEHVNKKTEKKVSNGTFNNYKQHLTTFFNVIKDREVISKNPVHAVKNLTVQETRNVAFIAGQKAEIKAAIMDKNPQLWIFAQIIYYSLMRPDELQNLQVKHIDLVNDHIFIPAEISKTRISRFPKITPPLRKVLDAMKLDKCDPEHLLFTTDGMPGPLGKARGENYFTRHHRKILDDLGYGPEYVLYSWKHTGVVDLYRAGVKDQYIMRQGGWRDVKVFQKYMRSLGLYENEELVIKAPEI